MVVEKVIILLSALIFEYVQVPSTTKKQPLFVLLVVVVYDYCNVGYTLRMSNNEKGNCEQFGEKMTNHESITIHYSKFI